MRSINPDQLRTLLTVVESRSFSAAARRLHLSQPAVSVQVRELEKRFGVALVERLGKQVHATPPGHALVEAGRRVLQACDDAEATMRRYRDGWMGRVRIGTTISALTYLLPPVLRKLSRDYPGIELHVTNMPTPESAEGIRQSRIDLAIVTLPVDRSQLEITPLLTERMVAIIPAGWEGIPDTVTPAYASRQPMVMEHTRAALPALILEWLNSKNAPLKIPMHLGTIEALKSATAASLGMAIIPETTLDGRERDIVVRQLSPTLRRTLALIEHHSKASSPALDIVRSALLSLREAAGSRPRAGAKQRPRKPTASAAAS
jgi:DNA-binding transcriptional LysR family regulator